MSWKPVFNEKYVTSTYVQDGDVKVLVSDGHDGANYTRCIVEKETAFLQPPPGACAMAGMPPLSIRNSTVFRPFPIAGVRYIVDARARSGGLPFFTGWGDGRIDSGYNAKTKYYDGPTGRFRCKEVR